MELRKCERHGRRKMATMAVLLLGLMSILAHPAGAFSSSSSTFIAVGRGEQRQRRSLGSFSRLEQSSKEQDVMTLTRQADANIETSFFEPVSTSASTQDQLLEAAILQAAMMPSQREYQKGLLTIGFCTLVFASMSPVMHAALNNGIPCPVVLLNAFVSVVAFSSLLVAGPLLESMIPPITVTKTTPDSPNELSRSNNTVADWWANSLTVVQKAGLELGLWKFLGTVANLYGLSMTTSDHGAFLIQLTTLIVPTVQGIMGVPIPQRIQWAVGLALAGVALFTQDASGTSAAASETRLWGDALCVVAAGFYATYDLRLFSWGKQVAARQLITTKIGVQAILSLALLVAVGIPETNTFIQSMNSNGVDTNGLWLLGGIVLWSGVMVNAIVPYLQVGGQQAIGPTRAQTLYASQPLWAAILSFFFLGETVGTNGLVGGGAFLMALVLAATAEAPDPNCKEDICEV